MFELNKFNSVAQKDHTEIKEALLKNVLSYWLEHILPTDNFMVNSVTETIESLYKSPWFLKNLKTEEWIENLKKIVKLKFISGPSQIKLNKIIAYLSRTQEKLRGSKTTNLSVSTTDSKEANLFKENINISNIKYKSYETIGNNINLDNSSHNSKENGNIIKLLSSNQYSQTGKEELPQGKINIISNKDENIVESTLEVENKSKIVELRTNRSECKLECLIEKAEEKKLNSSAKNENKNIEKNNVVEEKNENIKLNSQFEDSILLLKKETIREELHHESLKSVPSTVSSNVSFELSQMNMSEFTSQKVLNPSESSCYNIEEILKSIDHEESHETLAKSIKQLSEISLKILPQITNNKNYFLKFLNLIEVVAPVDAQDAQIQLLSTLAKHINEEKAVFGISNKIVSKILKFFSIQPKKFRPLLLEMLAAHINKSNFKIEISVLISMILCPFEEIQNIGIKSLISFSGELARKKINIADQFENQINFLFDLTITKKKRKEFRTDALTCLSSLCCCEDLKPFIMNQQGMNILKSHLKNDETVDHQILAAKCLANLIIKNKEIKQKIFKEFQQELKDLSKSSKNKSFRTILEQLMADLIANN